MNNSKYIRIIEAAGDLVKADGLHSLTRLNIGQKARVAPSLVSHYLGDMPKLINTLMMLARDSKDAELLARGLALKHPVAMAAPPELRRKAIRFITAEVGGK